MNTIYRIVWNAATGKWIVASELAKGRKKATKSSRLLLTASTASLALASIGAFAQTATNPAGTIVGGAGGANSIAVGQGSTTSCGIAAAGALLNPDYIDGSCIQGSAFGNAAVASNGGTAIGDHAKTSGFYGVALGAYSSAATHATAVGPSAMAGGADSFAGGVNSTANGSASTALGNRSTTLDAYATAVGNNASALTNSSVAIGSNAKAGFADGSGNPVGANQVALGMGTQALADRSVALGAGAGVDAAATYGMAMGRSASVTATGVNAVALGQASVADRANTVSVGAAGSERQVVNVAAGTQNTDAVNFAQLKGTAQSVAGALGGGAAVNADGTITAPSYTIADIKNGGSRTTNSVGDALTQLNANTTNLDGRVTTNTDDIAAIRRYSKVNGTVASSATGTNTIAIGNGAQSNVAGTADGNIAIGSNAKNQNTGAGSIVMGRNATIQGTGGNGAVTAAGSIAMGDSATIYGNNAIAFGARATVSSTSSVAIGADAAATRGEAVAIGHGARASAAYAVALGQNSVATRDNTVSVGSDTNTRQIVNVAAGTQDTDAVNLSQLKATNDQMAQNTTNITNLDGRMTVNEGDITKLQATVADAVMYDSGTHASVTLGGASATSPVALKNVADGALTDASTEAVNGSQLKATNDNVAKNTTDITNLDGRVTVNEGDIVDIRNKLGAGSIGLVQQAAAGADLTVGKDTDGARVVFADKDGKSRVLTGVANGALTDTSTEAVNGSQLKATNDNVTKNTTSITNLDSRVTVNEGNITNLLEGKTGLVQQADANAAVTVAAATGGSAVNFAGTAGDRQLKGVAAGTADNDAVNVSQLKSAGLIGDGGNVANVVVYDSAAKNAVTLGGSGSAPVALKNVAGGELSSTSTEAVNGSQLYATNQQVAKNTGDITTINNQLSGVVANNKYIDINSGTWSNDIAAAAGNGSTAIGANAQALAISSVALGGNTVASGGDSTAVGRGAQSGMSSVAIGASTRANNTSATAIGYRASASAVASTAVGNLANASGDRATALGSAATASGAYSLALGRQAVASHDNAVALGQDSATDRDNSVSVGSAGHERQITNVADGSEDTDAVNVRQLKAAGLVGSDGSTLDAVVYDAGSSRAQVTFGGINGTLLTNVAPGRIAEGSMDAVNGSQLWGVQNQLNLLGDRVTNVENNLVQPVVPSDPINPVPPVAQDPHFASNGDSAKPAVASGTGSVAAGENAQATGNGSTAIGAGSTASADNSVAVGSGSVADRNDTVSVGSAGSERQVTHVAAGTATTDAANVGQLNDVRNWAQSYTDQRVNALERNIDKVNRRAAAGTASAIAMANMPQGYAPGMNTVSAGVGTFNGQNAVAVGMTGISESGRWIFRASATANGQGDRGAGFGAAMAW